MESKTRAGAWPSRVQDFMELVGARRPIVQAPMAGVSESSMAISVLKAGGLGSLPCATWSLEKAAEEARRVREACPDQKFNMNFFCHETPQVLSWKQTASAKEWQKCLERAYSSYNISEHKIPVIPDQGLAGFNEATCRMLEEVRPGIVSFHFGLPAEHLLQRVLSAGLLVMSSATSVKEAKYLQKRGCHIIIAQGYEAGGHQATFLPNNFDRIGTMALVPQIVDAVSIPVIAAGGISDHRGVVAALALGASGIQMGTALLRTPQALTKPFHRAALDAASTEHDNCNSTGNTVLTNVFSGRPARSIRNPVVELLGGPLSPDVPPFPSASASYGPLREKNSPAPPEHTHSLWSGQAAALVPQPYSEASELVTLIADRALRLLASSTLDDRSL